MHIACPCEVGVLTFCHNSIQLLACLNQRLQTLVYLGGRAIAALCVDKTLIVVARAMNPAAVIHLVRVFFVSVIIEGGNLIAKVN